MAIQTLSFPVHGMTCGNCARSVERKLAGSRGVSKVAVDLGAAKATVEYDAEIVTPQSLADAVRQLGYEVPA